MKSLKKLLICMGVCIMISTTISMSLLYIEDIYRYDEKLANYKEMKNLEDMENYNKSHSQSISIMNKDGSTFIPEEEMFSAITEESTDDTESEFRSAWVIPRSGIYRIYYIATILGGITGILIYLIFIQNVGFRKLFCTLMGILLIVMLITIFRYLIVGEIHDIFIHLYVDIAYDLPKKILFATTIETLILYGIKLVHKNC